MGRRKIKMEMVQDMNTRQVTFSKRRTGLFKKASELATLCNAELGIVVFSPGGKPFSYGKPNLDAKLKKMNERLDFLNQEIEAEKKRGEKAQENFESAGDERFKKPIEKLTIDELKEYNDKLQTVHDRIQGQISQMQASSSLMLLLGNNKAPENLSVSDLLKLDHHIYNETVKPLANTQETG